VAAKFKHISIHPEIWLQATPTSSTSCHLFLRAVKLLEAKGAVAGKDGVSNLDRLTWAFRTAFFTELADISVGVASRRESQNSIKDCQRFGTTSQ
jgi:hypothetical protein